MMISNKLTPLLSIIVPIYNVDIYLKDCIESILKQSIDDFELILVDDGSTDGCGYICDEYESKDSRIRVIHQDNRGISAARETGFCFASGDYIGFVDSDDVIAYNMYERLVNLIIENDADISCCGYKKFSNDITECSGYVKPDLLNERLFNNKQAVEKLICRNDKDSCTIRYELWNKIYKRELLDKVFDSSLKEILPNYYFDDIFLTPLLLYHADKIITGNDELYFYRQREGSYVHNIFNLKKIEIIKVEEILLKCYISWNIKNVYSIALREYGNTLIKTYIEVLKLGNFSEQQNLLKEFQCKFNKSYISLLRKSKGTVLCKISFILFRINPKVWYFVAGRYYLKNYRGLRRRK